MAASSSTSQRNGAFGQAVETLRAQPGNPFGLFVVSSPQYLLAPGGWFRGRISAYRGAPPSVQPLGSACEGTLARVPHLAKMVGCSASTISLIESGQRQPSLAMAQKIARALRTPFDLFTVLGADSREDCDMPPEDAEFIGRRLLAILANSDG